MWCVASGVWKYTACRNPFSTKIGRTESKRDECETVMGGKVVMLLAYGSWPHAKGDGMHSERPGPGSAKTIGVSVAAVEPHSTPIEREL